MTTPLVAPPEAQPSAEHDDHIVSTESLARPFRLGLVGLGAAIGLFVRLLAANGFGELNSRPLMLGAAATSAVMGLGLLLVAAERDRFGAPLAWISGITAVAWGALNWISPPFASSVTVWSQPDQAVLAVLGIGNGLLLAGIVALACVRRHPTMTVAALLVASVLALAANSIVLREEWASIICLGIAFALILLAWDRSPRRELTFTRPDNPSRVSRAALSFVSVALCGTAIQLWTSRTDIPRSIPAVLVCALLIIGAFASLVRVRREIEQRETTLSEWTSWAREIRTNDFRAEMQNFESDGSPSVDFDARSAIGTDGEAPRKLSFPGLSTVQADSNDRDIDSFGADELAAAAASVPSPAPVDPAELVPGATTTSGSSLPVPDLGPAEPSTDTPPAIQLPSADLAPKTTPLPHVAPAAAELSPIEANEASGVFSSMLSADQAPAPPPATRVQIADLHALANWLSSPVAQARVMPLLVAIEAMSLDEFESLPAEDAAVATEEIGSFLADTMPDADMVSWIDGPYFIVAHASKPDSELLAVNKDVLKSLKATDGTLALVRPAADAELSDVVDECVLGLLHARQAKERAAGR